MTPLRLDGERIRRLCSEQQTSMRQLGACLGASGQRVLRLLSGEGVQALTLRDLHRLGERLGVDGLSLLMSASPNEHHLLGTGDDAAKTHAVLARVRRRISRQELAAILDWDLRRTGAALKQLEARLTGTGEVLHRVSASYAQLRARDEALTDDERTRADRLSLNTTGLTKGAARLLLRLVETDGVFDMRQQQRVTERRMLVKQGLALESLAGELRLHPDVSFSLGLRDAGP